MAYQGIRIKKSKSGSETINTDAYSIWVESVPFKLIGGAKELYANNWHDENGLDEYVPEQLKIDSYDLKIAFIYRGSIEGSAVSIKRFLDYLTGADGTGAEMSIYDPYYKIGRGEIRYKSVYDDAEIIEGGDDSLVKFSVTFQVNDPVTEVAL